MSNAIAGVGTELKRGDGASPEVFTAFGEILKISGPTVTAETKDVTNLSSGQYREYIVGFLDAGELSFDMNWIRADYEQVLSDIQSRVAHNYQLVLPDTDDSTFEFAALTTGIPMEIPADDKIMASITLKITGAITLAS